MTKTYTFILYYRGRVRVSLFSDLHTMPYYLSKHNRDFRIIAVFHGDFKTKIRRFGINKFLECIEACDNTLTIGLCFRYNRL
jgi:hypothetical protein